MVFEVEGVDSASASAHPVAGKLRKLWRELAPSQPTAGDGCASKQKTRGRITDVRRRELRRKFEKKYPHAVWGSDRVAVGDRTVSGPLPL